MMRTGIYDWGCFECMLSCCVLFVHERCLMSEVVCILHALRERAKQEIRGNGLVFNCNVLFRPV